MRPFISSIAILTLIGSLHLGAFAQNNLDLSVKQIDLNQANQVISLETKEVEPIFENQTQPDTCYRDVQHGTRRECNTEYDHQCRTTHQNQCSDIPHSVCSTVSQNVCHDESYPVCQSISRRECNNVPHSVCSNVPEQVCNNVPTQVCSNESVPVCQSVPRQVCETTQQCTTINHSVCHGTPPNQVCQNVPRRQCSPTQSCHSVNDSVCHNETRQHCSTTNHQECHSESRQRCHDESTQECRNVPDTVCHNQTRQSCHLENQQQCHDEYTHECHLEPVESCRDIPHEVCNQVPNTVSEPYVCTKEVPVQVGERIKNHSTATIQISLQNPSNLDLIAEKASIKLEGNEVKVELTEHSGKILFHLLQKEIKPLVISETETQISGNMVFEVISVDQLSSITELKITEPVLNFDKVLFKLSGGSFGNLPIAFDKAHLQLVMKKNRRKEVTLFDQDFDPLFLKRLAEGSYELDFSSLNLSTLQTKEHHLSFSFVVKSTLVPKEFLNPRDLPALYPRAIVGDFAAFPTETQN